MGLRGGVQLEWYKRVVPAGRNKITCGGEQTNTLSSDNEHLLPLHCGSFLLCLLNILCFRVCRIHGLLCSMCVCSVCCVHCISPMLCSNHTGCFTGACARLRTSRGVTHVVTAEYLPHFLARPYFCAKSLKPSPRFRATGQTSTPTSPPPPPPPPPPAIWSPPFSETMHCNVTRPLMLDLW